MSNVMKFKKPAVLCPHRIQATPDGIAFTTQNDEGAIPSAPTTRLLGYATALRQLDNGEFDTVLSDGLRVIAEIQQADMNDWFTPSDEGKVTVWRWIVACLFINEQRDKNGVAEVDNEIGGIDRGVIYTGEQGGMVIYPASERCSLSVNIDGVAIAKYGAEAGLKRALLLYQGMVEADQEDGALRLSDWGRDALITLHDDFLNTLNADGLPVQHTTH